MTISSVKKDLLEHIGDLVKIKYNLGRNKYESYNVVIKELYDYIFTVRITDSELTKSFSYADIISKLIKIDI